nr:hypothetical protein [uncultured bacterium]
MMLDTGSKTKNIKAQIFGGAFNPEISEKDIGNQNAEIAKKILKKNGINIISEDIGGQIGRKVIFNTKTNEILVIKVEKLRKEDWFPYNNER